MNYAKEMARRVRSQLKAIQKRRCYSAKVVAEARATLAEIAPGDLPPALSRLRRELESGVQYLEVQLQEAESLYSDVLAALEQVPPVHCRREPDRVLAHCKQMETTNAILDRIYNAEVMNRLNGGAPFLMVWVMALRAGYAAMLEAQAVTGVTFAEVKDQVERRVTGNAG
ncbi:MAG: hypothetical protein ACM3RP_07135 [Chitinophagales bacterium]